MTKKTTKKSDVEEYEPQNTTEKIIQYIAYFIICLIFYGFYSWLFGTSETSTSSSVNISTSQESVSSNTQESIGICNKVVDAFNVAFNNNPYSSIKLEAVKAKVKNEDNKNVQCTIFIKNIGNEPIKLLSGYLHCYDADNVSDTKTVFISKPILPDETIKDDLTISKDTNRMEVKNKEGNPIFNYNYNFNSY